MDEKRVAVVVAFHVKLSVVKRVGNDEAEEIRISRITMN